MTFAVETRHRPDGTVDVYLNDTLTFTTDGEVALRHVGEELIRAADRGEAARARNAD